MSEACRLLNALDSADAARTLYRCCGAQRWVQGVLRLRPFASEQGLIDAARRVWERMTEPDWLEAFSHHPRIGADLGELRCRFGLTADLSAQEQAGANSASAEVLEALARDNEVYQQRFGFVFLVCATGKSAAEMLTLLQERLPHDRATELRVAAAEQFKITRLRLLGLSEDAL